VALRDLPRIEVFAVEDRSAQICWPGLPAPDLTLEIGGQELSVGTAAPAWYAQVGLRGRVRVMATRIGRQAGRIGREAGRGRIRVDGSGSGPRDAAGVTTVSAGAAVPAGPGAVTVSGLEPATTYDVVLGGSGRPRTRVASVTTLPPPPGRLLSRFATISDCHIGEPSIGPLGQFRDPKPRPPGLAPYPVRCARAAISEAEAWGAELLVAKGDLTYNGAIDEVNDAADVLQTASIPVEVILGNHDVRGPADAARLLSARGLPTVLHPRARELPGIRLVLGHSPLPDRHAGAITLDDAAELAGLAGAASGPVVVALHHPPSRWPVQTHYPPSIVWRDSTRLVDQLAAANSQTLIVAGHTHRNRRYLVRGLTVAEVGSTKDYPGVWAGYSIYEGGIRQVVYRVSHPSAIAWSEITRRAIGGVWGWWSPGRLSDRCWTLEWR
jgi:predicted phosphodiesterase